jgi:hypothetical protein
VRKIHRSTRKPPYRVIRRRWRLRTLRCRLRTRRWRSHAERHFYRIWRHGRWRSLREKGMLWRRLIDGDLNRLRQETVLGEGHRLGFDRQCEGAGCLTGLPLPGAHFGAGWFRLELQGLRRRRRRPSLQRTERQRRAACERRTYRRGGGDEDESSARHDRFCPKDMQGRRLRNTVHRRGNHTPCGSIMVNVELMAARPPDESAERPVSVDPNQKKHRANGIACCVPLIPRCEPTGPARRGRPDDKLRGPRRMRAQAQPKLGLPNLGSFRVRAP